MSKMVLSKYHAWKSWKIAKKYMDYQYDLLKFLKNILLCDKNYAYIF